MEDLSACDTGVGFCVSGDGGVAIEDEEAMRLEGRYGGDSGGSEGSGNFGLQGRQQERGY